MIPSSFAFLDNIPLTPNGKTDRDALLALSLTLHQEEAPVVVPPRTPLERMVARAWGEVLDHVPDSIHQDFFAAGGNSLLAIQLLTRLRQQFEIELPLEAMLTSPTIAALSRTIESDLLRRLADMSEVDASRALQKAKRLHQGKVGE
jgi:acyl carrier protein